jgi:hypothetical protein
MKDVQLCLIAHVVGRLLPCAANSDAGGLLPCFLSLPNVISSDLD